MSHTFDENTIYWPTAKSFKLTNVYRNYTKGGFWYEASELEAGEHGGTHMDAPAHFSKNKWRSDDIPLECLIGPAVVVDVSSKAAANANYLVTAKDFQQWEDMHGKIPDGCLLFVKTGWGKFWPNELLYLGTDTMDISSLHFPGIHPDGARWLVQNRGMNAVGIDTCSMDYGQSTKFETHRILYANNVPGLENVANLDKLPTKGATVYALPIKSGDGSGGPVRIVGIIDNTTRSTPTPRPILRQKVIDMTHTFDEDTLYRPGRKPFRLINSFRNYTDGYWYEESEIEATEHGGTHMDAPAHFSKNKWRSKSHYTVMFYPGRY
ncbi:isatin hydrolase-like [Branchiostoma lanceolatum]|uniref:isatin hydrolase-like n=1 Tax=Branchiostoma lanceolatum TaxID=7740 RepID=UPI003452078B